MKTRRQRKIAGNAPLNDPITSAVDRILQENGESQTQSGESSTESEQETPANASKAPDLVATSRNTAVNYCPRREFLPLAPGTCRMRL